MKFKGLRNFRVTAASAFFFLWASIAFARAPDTLQDSTTNPCASALATSILKTGGQDERLALFENFLKVDYPEKARARIVAAISDLRTKSTREEKIEVLRGYGDFMLRLARERFGVEELGFHFNHHGGQADQYVKAGGLRAARGDISNNYLSYRHNLNYSVYMFRSSQQNPADVLGEVNSDGGLLTAFFSGRMGWVLNVFAVDSPSLNAIRDAGGVSDPRGAAMNFSKSWLDKSGMIGVPYRSYLFPPVDLFSGRLKKTYRELGRIRREEETLMALILMIEIMEAGKNWIGKSWDFIGSIEASAEERARVDLAPAAR